MATFLAVLLAVLFNVSSAFAADLAIAQSQLDSTVRVLEFDPATDAVIANHAFTQPASTPHFFVVTGRAGAAETLFALGLDGTTVWVSDMPAKGVIGTFNAITTDKLTAIAPYSSDSIIGVTKQNEVLLISKSGAVKQLLPPSSIPVNKHASVFKMSRISGDRYAMVADRSLLIVNVANPIAAIEKEFVFTDGPSIKSSLSTITVQSVWEVVADDKRIWLNVEFLDGMGASRHAAVLVDPGKGVQSMFRMHSSVSTRFAGIESATGNLILKTLLDLAIYDSNGAVVSMKLDRFNSHKLNASGVTLGNNPFLSVPMSSFGEASISSSTAAPSAAPRSVLDPVEPSEFRELMKLEEKKNSGLVKMSDVKNVVTTASELASYVNRTGSLKYFFKSVRDELARHGLGYSYDSLDVLPGRGATPIAIEALLDLLSRGVKTEQAQKQCASILTNP